MCPASCTKAQQLQAITGKILLPLETGDVCSYFGRAQEGSCCPAGMMWLWDLSSCLGWQKGGPTGLWMQNVQVKLVAPLQSDTSCTYLMHTLSTPVSLLLLFIHAAHQWCLLLLIISAVLWTTPFACVGLDTK